MYTKRMYKERNVLQFKYLIISYVNINEKGQASDIYKTAKWGPQ